MFGWHKIIFAYPHPLPFSITNALYKYGDMLPSSLADSLSLPVKAINMKNINQMYDRNVHNIDKAQLEAFLYPQLLLT